LPRPRYSSPETIVTFLRRLSERAAELPGVERAAAASLLPLSGGNARTDFLVVAHPPASTAEVPGAQWRFVGPGYFETLRLPLRAGRTFAATDDARSRPVVIVDAALVRRFLGGGDAVGAHLVLDDGVRPRDVEIVGVVGDISHFRLEDDPSPTLYLPIDQLPATLVGALAASASLVVRGHPGERPPSLDQLVAAVDSGVAASVPQPMTDLVAATLAARRLALALVTVFAGVALLLAVTGLAALVATSVAQQTREIGVRLALGATAPAIVRSIVAGAARLVAIGIAVGTAGAFVVTRAVSVGDPADPLAFAGAAALLGAVALVAAWIPARRVAAVDPMVALRTQ
jgi:predicted permease